MHSYYCLSVYFPSIKSTPTGIKMRCHLNQINDSDDDPEGLTEGVVQLLAVDDVSGEDSKESGD